MGMNGGNIYSQSRGYRPGNPQKKPEPKDKIPQNTKQHSTEDLEEIRNSIEADEKRCSELEAAIEVLEILTAIPKKINSPQDIQALLQEQDSYLDQLEFYPSKKVRHVMLSDRPEGKNLWEKLSPEYQQKLLGLENASQAREFLSQELETSGLSLEMIEYQPPTDANTRRVLRIEFAGKIFKPDADNLSEAYLQLLENPAEGFPKAQDYNLEESEVWQIFKKFPKFQKIENDFKEALALQRIPPEKIKELNAFDLESILFDYKSNGEDVSNVHLFEGSKETAVKIYTRNHREELETYFHSLGANEKDIEKVLEKMEKRGQHQLFVFRMVNI